MTLKIDPHPLDRRWAQSRRKTRAAWNQQRAALHRSNILRYIQGTGRNLTPVPVYQEAQST